MLAMTTAGPPRRVLAANILRRPDEHLHHVIVHAVVKLALKSPLELRMLQVARMHLEQISMQAEILLGAIDHDLDRAILLAAAQAEQRMLILGKLALDALESGHKLPYSPV